MQVENKNINSQLILLKIVETKNIPVITTKTQEVFGWFGVYSPDLVIFPLKNRVEALRATAEQLREAGQNKDSAKVFALLKSALILAVVAVGIFGTCAVSSPALSVVIAFATFLTYTGLSTLYSEQACFNLLKSDLFGMMLIILFGPLYPIYEGFAKIPNLQETLNYQSEEIIFGAQELIKYFSGNFDRLESQITSEIERTAESIKFLGRLPIVPESGRQELNGRLNQLTTALDQLTRAKAFYNQFNS